MLNKNLALARWPSFWPQVTQFWTWPKNHQDKHFEQDSWWLLENVTARVITMFSADLARWPSFWPQVTQFQTWPRNHQDKHSEQDSWWLLTQVTPMLPRKFGVNWPFSSGGEAKNRFSRWLSWRPTWISDWNDFSYFWSISHPDASYHVWSQLAFGFRRRSINRFSRWLPWISDRHDFSYFWSTSHPDAS